MVLFMVVIFHKHHMLYLSVGKYFITNVPREKKLSYLTLRSVVVSLYSSIFRKKKYHIILKLQVCWKFALKYLYSSLCFSSVGFLEYHCVFGLCSPSFISRCACFFFSNSYRLIKSKIITENIFGKKWNTFHTDIQTKYMWFYWICVFNENTMDDFILIRHNI